MKNPIRRLWSYIPAGGSLPEEVWRQRHRFLTGLAWLHALAIALVGLIAGYSKEVAIDALFDHATVLRTMFEGLIVGVFAALGSWSRLGRTVRSVAVSFGLITASAIFVHLSGGYIELHFHFFVMLVFLALYQDWVPYLIGVAYVALHHGVLGTIWPEEVFNHSAAIDAPWTWGGIHAFFVLWQCVGSVIAWRFSEKAAAQTRLILNSAGEGIYGLDRNGKVVFVNPVAAVMFGLQEHEIVGRPVAEILDAMQIEERSDDASYRSLTAPPPGTTQVEGQAVLRRRDGTRIPIDYLSTLMMEEGELNGSVVSFRDVTERERAADALRQSQKQHQDLVQTIDGIVWEAGAQSFDFTFVSPQAERILGYPARRWIDEPSFWIDHLHPEDRGRVIRSFGQATAERNLHRVEYRMVASDGRTVWLGNIVSVVVENGRAVKLRGVMIDITQRREAEERARRTMKRLGALHEISMATGSTLEQNDLLEILTHKVSALLPYSAMMLLLMNKRTGKLERSACFNVDAEWMKRDIEETPRLIAEAIETGKAVATKNLQEDPRTRNRDFYQNNGLVSALTMPLIAKGEAVGALVFMTREEHDFTQEETDFLTTLASQAAMAFYNSQLYQQTRTQAAELERMNRQINDFTAMIAHDLRSPLSNVIGVGEMMCAGMFGPINDEQKKWLGKVLETSRGLVNLTGDFLDVAKLEAGRIDLGLEEVDVAKVLRSAVESYRLQAEEKKIHLRANIESSSLLQADPRRLEQVLNNLLSNALKFTPEGGAVELGASADGTAAKIWVKDTGAGIAPDELGRLFEKYNQSKSGKTSKHRGTGLGLVICKMIVEAHQGQIRAESAVGKGATVTFTIPLPPPEARAQFIARRDESALSIDGGT